MTFANSAKNYAEKYTRTEKGAVALNTTDSALLDLFATVGALRGKDEADIVGAFKKAFQEEPLLATRLAFYARDIRGGLGERKTFRLFLKYLANEHPEIVRKNIALISHFGRWDDYYTLVGTPVEDVMWSHLKAQFAYDLYHALNEDGESISLLAKWLKSVNTSSSTSRYLGRLTAKAFGMTERTYRKHLSLLRSYLDVVETKMSKNAWDEIDYEKVPSLAMKNYRNAFVRHDEEGFIDYITSVAKGEATIHASTLYPYDILRAGRLRTSGWLNGYYKLDEDPVLEQQWKHLPDFVDGEHQALVMADTSGSMTCNNGLPITTALGLALYFAERNRGPFKDLFLTFSEQPEFVSLKGATLAERIGNVRAIISTTDLEAAFQLILDMALSNNLPPEDLPQSLIIISDMQFDLAAGRDTDTFHVKMKDKFAREGYTLPTVIYWDVDSKKQTFQVNKDNPNVLLVSGHSTSVFKSVLGLVGKTPYDLMVDVLTNKRYQEIQV